MTVNHVDEFNKMAKTMAPWFIIGLILMICCAVFSEVPMTYQESMDSASRKVDNQVLRNHQLEREAREYNLSHSY